MKKILIGIILGFIIHSGLSTLYDYKFWTNTFKCHEKTEEADQKCVEYYAPILSILKYPLAHISYDFKQWGIRYP